MKKFCKNCGQEVESGNYFCINCGERIDTDDSSSNSKVESTNNTSNTTNNNNSSNVQYNNNVQTNSGQKRTNGLAIAGFVVSLVSSICCCGSLNVISLVLSIVGLANAKDFNGDGKGLAIAGIIISSVVLVIYILLYLFVGTAGTIFETIFESMYINF